MHELKIMVDPNDDISVMEEILAQPKANVSEPDVNRHDEPEVVIDVASQDLLHTQPGATGRNNIVSRQPLSSPGLNTTSVGLRRPSSSGGPAASSKPMSSSATRPMSSSTTRTSSNITSRPTSNIPSRPIRSSTPTSRSNMSSTKPTLPVRSSTPTPRSTERSSTLTSRSTSSLPATKHMSRASTLTRRKLFSFRVRVVSEDRSMQSTPSHTSSLSYQSSSSSLDFLISLSAVGLNPGSSLSFMKGDDDHLLESGNHFFVKWTSPLLTLIEEKQATVRAIKRQNEMIYS
uniref:Mucin-5AC isoform X1 n=1 Tax=Tanacetum cinerariifolium TaxID=118510 RepID=A0A699GQ47_TANCI|nr:mucin-5AC isoform X1 [Tanacetum cinerariifolium]